ncbi:pyridoxamine 5'-phosphate oxidase family protein [Paraburkholderia sp.]|uniref:pyridoxamine 5'-phosphate oxidase family protein n=1 Tax=Paraburkholderia sp. TaxID=1926495 RepID=UPI0025EB9A2E|nr:pyridoxamine 5'-phosphate oxidase family protein [Paraburkholderia sp.]
MDFYHEGSVDFQQRFDGTRLAKRLEEIRVHKAFWPDEIDQINGAHFFFLATAYGDTVDCSYKGGEPGFVRVIGPATLEWPDYDGNSMYRSLGNIKLNPNVGLLFVPFDAVSARLRINGKASLMSDRDRLALYPGAKVIVQVECRFIYKNCNRYIPRMELQETSAFSPKNGYSPPEPEWKSRDYAHDVLPSPERFKK